MGPMSILPRLPRIVRRVYQTVDAALAAAPDAVVVIDSPEFTHRSQNAFATRAAHSDHRITSPECLGLASGARQAHASLRRPRPGIAPLRAGCARVPRRAVLHYVGHPLIEKLDEIRNADAAALARRLGLAPEVPVVLVLPGSRTSEVERLIDVFGEAVRRVAASGQQIQIVIPAVRHVRDLIAARTAAGRLGRTSSMAR